MNRVLGLVFFSGLLTALAFLVLRGLWPALRTRRGSGVFWATAALVHLAFLGSWAARTGPGVPGTVTRGALTAWSVAALVSLVVGGLLRLAGMAHARLRPTPAPAPALAAPGRREFMHGLALPAVAATLGTSGTVAGMSGFEVRHEEVRLPGLPPALDGFRIGQLTDVHVGEFIDVEHVRGAVQALDAAGVDLQVMTGDLIDDLTQLDATLEVLQACKAPHGMLAILGNHEKWRGLDEVLAGYERAAPRGRLRLLVDQNEVLVHRGQPLRVVGVDYPMGERGRHRLPREQRLEKMRASAERAWAGVGPDETVLCLTHHPDFFPLAAERGARLTLAGHTHGGQVGFWRIPLFSFAFEHMLGRYRRGNSHLYVSSGTGHWFPFRMGIPAEVTVLTLRAA
ncbi:metallophosphoesterase [Archangium violaceum]|uniref:metallophosphoesterase n=1 Tax=Archangium violaceum TaxID=83451 RepID=UPI002B28575B|nr:metallophosphoesterase [Archangium gephyra]